MAQDVPVSCPGCQEMSPCPGSAGTSTAHSRVPALGARMAAKPLGSAASQFAWVDTNCSEQRSSEQEEDGWTVLINCFLCHILNNLVAIPAVCYKLH